jgi:hypothetical protein
MSLHTADLPSPAAVQSPLIRSIATSSMSVPMRLTEMSIQAAARDSPELLAESRSFRPIVTSPKAGRSRTASGARSAPPPPNASYDVRPPPDLLAAALLSSVATECQGPGIHAGQEAKPRGLDGAGGGDRGGSRGIASCDAAEAALARVEAAVADASASRRTGDGGQPARGKVLAARARLAEAKAQLQSLRSDVQHSLSDLKGQLEGDVQAAFAARGIPWAPPELRPTPES